MAHAKRKDCVKIGVQDGFGNPTDASGAQKRVKAAGLDGFKIGMVLQNCGNAGNAVGGQLAAVRAVDLEAVILGGIVAGRDADADPAGKRAHGIAQGGNGLESGIEICLNAVRGQNAGGFPGEAFTIYPAVVSDGGALGKARFVQIIGYGLRRAADDMDVHAVCAHAENAAQSAGSELQGRAECVVNDGGVILHGSKLFLKRRVERWMGAPEFKQFLGGFHIGFPFCSESQMGRRSGRPARL